jgi:hypothetical protein
MVRLPANVINEIKLFKTEIAKFRFINEEPVYGEILDKDNVKMDYFISLNVASLNDAINEINLSRLN